MIWIYQLSRSNTVHRGLKDWQEKEDFTKCLLMAKVASTHFLVSPYCSDTSNMDLLLILLKQRCSRVTRTTSQHLLCAGVTASSVTTQILVASPLEMLVLDFATFLRLRRIFLVQVWTVVVIGSRWSSSDTIHDCNLCTPNIHQSHRI